MGVEFQRNIIKALKLNEECKKAGLGNRCLAVVMTALTGSEEFGIHWIREINEDRGFPPFIGRVLPKAGFREAAIVGPGENIPLEDIRKILRNPKSTIRENNPTSLELVRRPIEGILINFEPKVERVKLVGSQKLEGHVTLIIPSDKLVRRSRRKLKQGSEYYYMIDADIESGHVTTTPEKITKVLRSLPPNFTSEFSILVRV